MRPHPHPLLAGLATSLVLVGAAGTPSPARANSIDRETIRRVIRPKVRAIYACWAREAARGATLGRGRAIVEFEIVPTGRVARAVFAVDPVRSAPVTQCIVGVFLSMRFPGYEGPGTVVIRYPLWFEPDGTSDD